jgi:hypothetical protein
MYISFVLGLLVVAVTAVAHWVITGWGFIFPPCYTLLQQGGCHV